MTTRYVFRLYVAGRTPNSLRAIGNLHDLAEGRLGGACSCEIIDLLLYPRRAGDDDVIATPTLVKKLPLPESRIIGNFSNLDRTLVMLGIDTEPAS